MGTFAQLLGGPPAVLDGGLGTLLDRHGHDVSGELWSARVLRDEPDAVLDAHTEFFAAGARVATTASYQVSRDGFRRAGLGDAEADRALATSVRLARAAADRADADADAAGAGRPDPRPADADGAGTGHLVAASVGPYGAVLADGSEYRGDYGLSVAELAAWHRPRIERLWATGPDVLAVETIPSAVEAEAVALALAGTGAVAWLSLTVAGGRTRAGDALEDVFAIADGTPEIRAAGVNCCAPAEVTPALRALRTSTDLPAVVYPNSGEEWDAKNRRWMGVPDLPAGLIAEWIAEGARLVGGCCRVGPEHISAIAAAISAATGCARPS